MSQNPGWEMGIRIGEAKTGWVTEFILFPWGDPRETAGNGAEFVGRRSRRQHLRRRAAAEAAAEVRAGPAIDGTPKSGGAGKADRPAPRGYTRRCRCRR